MCLAWTAIRSSKCRTPLLLMGGRGCLVWLEAGDSMYDKAMMLAAGDAKQHSVCPG